MATAPRRRPDSESPPNGRKGGANGDRMAGVPLVTIRRLYRYIRALELFQLEGQQSVSSELLASTVGVKASQLRKDLAYFGELGTRGKGYAVDNLLAHLSELLGLTREWPMVLVGVGNIGTALSRYPGLAERGFVLRALFDVNPKVVGTNIRGIPVHHLDRLTEICQAEGVAIAILTVPAEEAQGVADRLVAAGVRAILNVAPVNLQVPSRVAVRNVDIAVELRLLSYMLLAEGAAQPVASRKH
ncbi:MAG TPA: redox-sensing transcriptional repressor Rex [bacterium]|nr:redox-sensing transcriptional repressor Rex [bacterium]